MEFEHIKNNLNKVYKKIEKAAVKVGRDPNEVTIVAVTKNIDLDGIKPVVKEGLVDLGENRVQEMLLKQPHFNSEVHWHLIGHLQRNKVKSVVGKVKLIHSVDSWRLAEEISGRSEEKGFVSDVLIQVNVSGEKSKYGVSTEEVFDFIETCSGLTGLSVRGLMTMAPMVKNPEQVRPVFRELRDIRDRLRQRIPGIPLNHLSMGMTNDYQIAVEEGADLLRIGTAIFSTGIDLTNERGEY